MPTFDEPRDQTLWNIEQGSVEQYWIEYESVRPKYGDSQFLDIIYTYHASKVGSEQASFAVAHDIACGAGKAGRELACRFERVVASDSNESSLHAMRASCMPSVRNIEYILSAGEKIAQHAGAASADLMVAAECVPILDVPLALDNFAQVLKPDGTLAIWFYGRPHFAEVTYSKSCQAVFDQILEAVFYHIISSSSDESRSTWAAAAETMESWLDNVRLPANQWRSIQRHKWNNKSTEMGMGAAADGLNVVRKSTIRDEEALIEKEDVGMWRREFDIEAIKRYVMSSFPDIGPFVRHNRKICQLFDDLTEAMGGTEARRQITWPVSLILATPQFQVE